MTSKKELLEKKIGTAKATKKNKTRIAGYIIELLKIEREVEENNSKSSPIKHKFPTKKDKLQVDFPVKVIDYFKLCNSMGQPMGVCYRCGYAIKHTYILRDNSGFQFALGTTCIDRFDKESGDHIPNPEFSMRYQVNTRSWEKKQPDKPTQEVHEREQIRNTWQNEIIPIFSDLRDYFISNKKLLLEMVHPKFKRSRNLSLFSYLIDSNFFSHYRKLTEENIYHYVDYWSKNEIDRFITYLNETMESIFYAISCTRYKEEECDILRGDLTKILNKYNIVKSSE